MTLEQSQRELERIRQVRNGKSSEAPEAEILVCPVEGCSRTVVGEPANLVHHVRQSGDDAHRFKRMTEDLELVIDREEYHAMWGPRIRGDEGRGEDWSIYEDGDPWGPGIPETDVNGP